jgi:chitinase
LTPTSYNNRVKKWRGLSFGGISAWAVDLDLDYGKDGTRGDGNDGSGADDDGGELGIDLSYACNTDQTYHGWDSLVAAAGSIKDPDCTAYYALKILRQTLSDAVSMYNNISNGYDKKFAAYTRYIKSVVPQAIDSFMIGSDGGAGPGMKYFDCAYDEIGNNEKKMACSKLTFSDLGQGTYDLTFTLKDSDGFFKELNSSYGIQRDWVDLNTDKLYESEGCSSEGGISDCPTAGNRKFHKYPGLNQTLSLADPRALVNGTVSTQQDLKDTLDAVIGEYELGGWIADNVDVANTVSVPIFSLVAGVTSMNQVVELAGKEEKIEAKKKKEFILSIVGAVLFFVPMVGEAGALATGLTTLARVIAFTGSATDIAYGVYTIVDDPNSALMSLMGMFMGVGGAVKATRDAAGFAKMAKAKKAMSATDIRAMGTVFKSQNDALESVIGKMCSLR